MLRHTKDLDQAPRNGHGIGRQLTRCDATADTLNTDHLRELMNFLIGATTLPLHPDKEKKAELSGKLKALA